MRTFFTTLIIAVAILTSCNASSQSNEEPLRIMCYNVRNCKGLDLQLDYDRCADVIKRANPEVVAVQELDSMTLRYEGYYALGELAKRTQMHDYYAPSIDYKGGKYGVGILSKKPALSLAQYPLPCRKEPRTMLVAEFEKFYFICTHLSLVEEDRKTSAEIIRDVVAKLDKPAIIAGDFNTSIDSESMGILLNFCTLLSDQTQLTFPANAPDRCIDYILTNSSSVKGSNPTVMEEPVASDHRPLYVDVTL
jgi:endonuclease/exonuclease/phosphatase family metal-dependent hydrolase